MRKLNKVPSGVSDLFNFMESKLPESCLDSGYRPASKVRAHFFAGIALLEDGASEEPYDPEVNAFAYDIQEGDVLGQFEKIGDRLLDDDEVLAFQLAIGNDGTYFEEEDEGIPEVFHDEHPEFRTLSFPSFDGSSMRTPVVLTNENSPMEVRMLITRDHKEAAAVEESCRMMLVRNEHDDTNVRVSRFGRFVLVCDDRKKGSFDIITLESHVR